MLRGGTASRCWTRCGKSTFRSTRQTGGEKPTLRSLVWSELGDYVRQILRDGEKRRRNMTMPEILRRKLMERIEYRDPEPDDVKRVLEEIDRLHFRRRRKHGIIRWHRRRSCADSCSTVCGGSMSCRSCWKMRELPKLW